MLRDLIAFLALVSAIFFIIGFGKDCGYFSMPVFFIMFMFGYLTGLAGKKN